MSGWPRGRSADGGIDEIPLPGVTGRLWLCGKHLVGPDPAAALARVDATAILCLNQRHEIDERYPDYVAWLEADHERAGTARWFPTPDLGVRPFDAFQQLVVDSAAGLGNGDRLIAHCGAGIGRAGTFAVAVLLTLGLGVDEALDLVAASRPMAGPEAGSQRELIERFGRAAG